MANNSNPKVTLAQAARDVLIASMRFGQFPFAGVMLVVIILVVRLPPGDSSKLVFEILTGLKSGQLIGYLLAAVITVAWFVHSKYQRRGFQREIERIGKEKSALQEKALGDKIEPIDPKANKKAKGV